MAENAYSLRVPLGPKHWIMVVSNQPMTPECFARLSKYLALQEEIFSDDAKAMSASGQDQNGLGAQPASAVGETDLP